MYAASKKYLSTKTLPSQQSEVNRGSLWLSGYVFALCSKGHRFKSEPCSCIHECIFDRNPKDCCCSYYGDRALRNTLGR
uniref:Uncharacterized protein n=1 Tax=Arion vulgaris TaxID=1028688 RepID=A0A0B7B3V0_9EUPU